MMKKRLSRIPILNRISSKGFLLVSSVLFTGLCLLLIVYISLVRYRVNLRFEQLSSSKSSQFFAFIPPLEMAQRVQLNQMELLLQEQGYHEKKSGDEKGIKNLLPREYSLEKSEEGYKLSVHRPPLTLPGPKLDRLIVEIHLQSEGSLLKIKEILQAENALPIDKFEFAPKQIGSFSAGRIRTQNPVALSEIPVAIRHAVMAIEDVNFLEHRGVSLRSTLRALWKDIKAKRFVEGGSTITQQLMKNLFFSREKALSRKIKEAIYAFVTDLTHTKESILEAYLNEVYMGQWSTHEIHGLAEGARFYFNRDISDVALHEAATLAAIIQAPNNHDPRRFPDNTLKRRNLVLKKMLEASFILKGEYELAVSEPLSVIPHERSLQDLGYFMDLVMVQLPDFIKTRLDNQALSVYTTLNPYLQSLSTRALRENLERLETHFPTLKKKAAKGHHLQSSLIAIDVPSNTVISLQGGHSYQKTQFNRILQGNRQPGSLFKPFVFLTAFDKPSPDEPITALTELEGTPFEWKYEGQSWSPKNYDKSYPEKLTARETLEQSVNVPTARLAQRTGIGSIIDTLRKAGMKSVLPEVPSLCLGSADVNPLELAESYTTVANLGSSGALRAVSNVYDEEGKLIWENKQLIEERLPKIATFLTVQLMKGVFTHGTAKSALASNVETSLFAGKTGTTNDYKDAWFVGFSPKLLVLVWVGYDEEEKIGLTGSTAALPLWLNFVKGAQPFLNQEDFKVPEEVQAFEIDRASKALATNRCPEKQKEYFRPGTQPRGMCPLHP